MPNNNRGGYTGYTAAEKKSVQLPDRFACDYCKKMKAPTQFSEKEKNKYRHNVLTGQKVHQFNNRMRCISCTGGQIVELQCNGPCGLYRGLEEFSKSARTQGDSSWCIKCTQWKEAHEPGLPVLPAPNSEIAPDEEHLTVAAVYDPEGDADSDDDEDRFYNNMSNMSVTEPAPNPTANTRPPSMAAASNDENTPPHLRAEQNSQTSASNPYTFTSNLSTTASNSGTATEEDGGVWITEDRRRRTNTQRNNVQTYQAFDSQGNVHERERTITDTTTAAYASGSRASSSRAGSTPSRVANVPTGKSGWAKVPNNKTRGFAPQTSPGKPMIANASSGVQYRDDDDDSQDES